MVARRRTRAPSPFVVLTREARRNRPLAEALSARGVAVVEVTLTRTVPPRKPAPLAAVAADPARYDWIVFTSARGVDAFCGARRRVGQPPFGRGFAPKLAAIGDGTTAAIRRAGGRVAFVPEDSRAEGLAAGWPEDPRGQRILLPRPLGGRPEATAALRARGAIVREVTAYRTVDARLAAARLRRAARVGESWIVVLAAPSAVAALARGLRRLGLRGNRPAVVAIGPTTARAAARLRPLFVETAARPTESALLAATKRALARRTGIDFLEEEKS